MEQDGRLEQLVAMIATAVQAISVAHGPACFAFHDSRPPGRFTLIVKECVSAPGEAIVAYLCHRFREIEGKLGMVPGIVRPTAAANPHELATPLDAAGLAVMTE